MNELRFRTGELNRATSDISGKIPPEKLLADMLKRQARQIMAEVTTCQADAISAHLSGLDRLADLIEHHLRHDLSGPEARLSGRQLATPYTLADHLACLEITRRNHRAPAGVDITADRDAEILRKLDQIAFFVSQNQNTNTINIEEK